MPENALTGTIRRQRAARRPVVLDGARFGAHRAWRGTAVRTGRQTRVALAGVLGHEWDEVVDNGALPPLLRSSETSVDNVQCIMDHGATFDSGSATHNLVYFRDPASKAWTFGAGTVQWAWALDATHDANDPQRANKYNIRVEEDARGPDRDLQQLTVNVFQDMGVLPATLDPTLRLVDDAVDDEPPAVTLSSAAVVGGVAVLSRRRVDARWNVAPSRASWSPGRWHLATLDRIAPDVTWSLRWGDEPWQLLHGAPPAAFGAVDLARGRRPANAARARRGLALVVAAGEDVGADLPSATRSDCFASSGDIRAKQRSRRSTLARTS
ncbi:hypothetical protein SO694_00083059 [Aureococcus anophagefferens]|uniref:N,N-dimethylformamidase beta subunit-like C-terminal domain-containing protein n=1 Tax=Aureococcus anophagefferens TaxID=44056 RepID=A0ABR1FJ88_AURAN